MYVVRCSNAEARLLRKRYPHKRVTGAQFVASAELLKKAEEGGVKNIMGTRSRQRVQGGSAEELPGRPNPGTHWPR